MSRYSGPMLIASAGTLIALAFRIMLSSRIGLTVTCVQRTLFAPLNHLAFWTALLLTGIAVFFSVRARAKSS